MSDPHEMFTRDVHMSRCAADALSTSGLSAAESHTAAQPRDLHDLIMQTACALQQHPGTTPERLSTLLDTFTRLLAPAAVGAASADGLLPGDPTAAAPAAASVKLEQFATLLRSAEDRVDELDDPAKVQAVLRELLQRGALALEDTQRVHEQVCMVRPLA